MAFFNHDFGVKEPRHSENEIVKKTVYLNTYTDFGVKEPRHSENEIAKKRYTLTRILILALRSPVTQKTKYPKNGIP